MLLRKGLYMLNQISKIIRYPKQGHLALEYQCRQISEDLSYCLELTITA